MSHDKKHILNFTKDILIYDTRFNLIKIQMI